MTEKLIPKCSFCGKTQDKVHVLLTESSAYICDECVLLCCKVLIEDTDADWAKEAARDVARLRRYSLAERLVAYEHIGLELRSEAESVLLEILRGPKNSEEDHGE